jgi:hypothetical protein
MAGIAKTTFTDEGFLRTEAVITRTGVFPYKQGDGSIILEFRPPNEVFSIETLDSMKMMPITNEHPVDKLVNSQTAKALSVGYVGETITSENNKNMWATLQVTDAKTIEDIKSGVKKQLSVGYTADLHEEAGVFEGQEYSHVQRNIRGNHLAIVKEGRMGAIASIKTDAQDDVKVGVQILDMNFENNAVEKKKMKSIFIDNQEFSIPKEVAEHINQINLDNANIKSELTQSLKKLEIKAKKCDALDEQLYDLRTRDTERQILKAAHERAQLLQQIKTVFGDVAIKNEATKNNLAIKKEVLQKCCDKKDLDKKSEVFVDALFEATVDAKREAGLAKQRETLSIGDKSDSKNIINESIKEFNLRLQHRGQK